MLIFNKDFGLGTMNDQGGGAVINNQDITITTNGEYTADEGYTGIGTATVDVPMTDVITALNNTGTAVLEGDKVWINQEAAYSSNFDIIGAPTLDETTQIASGFSSGNYLRLTDSFAPSNNTWEIVFKFKPYSVHNGCLMTKISYGADYGFRIEPVNSGQIYYLVSSSSGQTYLFEGVGSNDYVVNEWNWVKFEFTGSAYNAYISSDGISWTLDKTYSSSTVLYNFSANTNIGNHPEKTGFTLDGEIDLSASYIKINNSNWWVPSFTYVDCQIIKFDKQRNFSVVGNPTINDSTEIVSDFTSSNYLKFPKEFNPGSNPWEGIIKITTGSNFGTSAYTSLGLIGNTDSADLYKGPTIHFLRDGRMQFLVGNGSSWINSGGNIGYYTGSYYAQTNTTYWLKFGWTGSQYYLEYSLDGKAYTRDITAPFNTQMTGNIPTFGIVYGQVGRYDYDLLPFNGSIDLSETSIKINNGDEWKSYYSYISENSLTGVAKENIASGSTGQVETVLPE